MAIAARATPLRATLPLLSVAALAVSVPLTARPSQAVTTLDVGIVQRFGEQPQDLQTVRATGNGRLTVRFEQNGQTRNLAVQQFQIGAAPMTLPEETLREVVVLGTYRSFESAEESAMQWRSRGIAVEIAQPSNRWQVWADRDTYHTPLLRRLLYDSLAPLRDRGDAQIVVQSAVIRQVSRPVWTIGGTRYSGDRLQVEASNGVIQVGTQRYGGTLHLQPNAYGTYTLVNRVPIETYLRGVVPYEIGGNAPRSAVEAQAILARTYALRNVRRFAIDDYQMCADTHCQVYRGLNGATANSDRAIAATRNQVLTYNNELADTLYFSTSGGVTAAFEDVWNGPNRPYLRPVIDSPTNLWNLAANPLSDEVNLRRFLAITQGLNEVGWRDFRWRRSSTLAEIADGLRTYLGNNNHPLASLQRVERVAVIERAASGRVQLIEVTTDRGPVRIAKDAVRSAFMAPRSTLFYLEPTYGPAPAAGGDRPLTGYTFVGGGWGHGVGMSQAGSYRLARLGWSAAQILNFYYPGTTLQPLDSSVIYWREPELPPVTDLAPPPSDTPTAPASPAPTP